MKKVIKEVFTKNKVNDIINKNQNPFEVSYKIYKRRDGLDNMKNVILNEAIFIEEESYQKIKEKMNKKDDYFSKKEFEKFSVNLA